MQSKYLIFDRATNFSDEVASTIKSFDIEPKKPAFEVHGRTAWQNASWVVAAETCSITSSFSTNAISNAS
jgi:hypothetical protein